MIIFIIITIAIGFYMAWNIGANDVSNALGTAVGSKALTLKKAIVIAAIFEFSGAFFLGKNVSSTIAQGIISPQVFSSNHHIFAIGMLSALLATGIWLNLASYFKLPVSTTHAIVGAVLGFGIIIGGIHTVHWEKVLFISLSWIFSPLLGGLLSYLIFSLLQHKVLYALNPLSSAKKIIPFFVFFSFLFFSLNFIFKGFYIDFSFSISLLLSFILSLICFVISHLLLKKLPSFSAIPKHRVLPQQIISLEKALKHMQRTKLISFGDVREKTSSILKEIKKLKNEMKKKVEFSKTHLQYTNVEKVFAYLQILSICLVAFAHGANDVANAIGPVSAIVYSIKNVKIPATTPISILLLGAIGIVIGLATWGWRVVETIGKKITELTPTRGFSAEIGAATTILFASKLGLPISTTHVLVGSVLGVGFARGINALNLKMIRDIILSWIVTIPICAILSIFIFYIIKSIF